MSAVAENILPITVTLLVTFLIGLPAAWAALALWFQAPGGQLSRTVMAVLWLAFSAAMLTALWQGRAGMAVPVFAAVLGALLLWWRSIRPSNDRPWADDVARFTHGSIEGNRVTLHNVRNFDWRSHDDYGQRWESRIYNLDGLNSVDMIVSYWDGTAIAHMLVSFGFDDGQHVAFSVEVRR